MSATIRRFCGVCAYDGTEFNGWQSQRCGNTIQDLLEKQLHSVFKKPIRIHGAGRTDSGVHARGQVFHFDAPWEHDARTLHRALSSGLPESLLITRLREAPEGFHARYGATGKRYLYRLYLGYAPPTETRYCWSLGDRDSSLNLAAMEDAANRLVGTHDFSAFGASRGRGGRDERENPVKELRRLELSVRGRRMSIVTEGSGYLYKMVRSLAGTLVEVGRERLTPNDVERILCGRTRTHEVPTAPAKGLSLERVYY